MDAKLRISTEKEMINPVCEFTYNWGKVVGWKTKRPDD